MKSSMLERLARPSWAFSAFLAISIVRIGLAGDYAGEALFRGYVKSSGTQYINSGYVVTQNSILDLNFSGWQKVSNGIVFGYGRYNSDAYLLLEQSGTMRYWGNNMNLGAAVQDTDYHVWVESGNVFIEANGVVSGSSDMANAVTGVDGRGLCFFYMNAASVNYGKFNLHSAKLWDSRADYEAGKPARDLVPYRDASGRIGLYDRVHRTPCMNAGSGDFALGGVEFTYGIDGTRLLVREGRFLTDEMAAFPDCTVVEKVGGGTVNGSAVKSCPALTVSEGTYSLMDDDAAVYRVNGPLTLKGGVRLEMEIAVVHSDQLKVASLDLGDASAENPVTIAIDQVRPGFRNTGASRVLIAGACLTAEDLDKFKLESSLPLRLGVEGGDLVVTVTDDFPVGCRTVAYLRSTGSQYLLTGVTCTPSMNLEMDFGNVVRRGIATQDGFEAALFGTDAWYVNRCLMIVQSSSDGSVKFRFYGGGGWTANEVEGADYHLEITDGHAALSANGETLKDAATATDIDATDKELAIFGLNKSTTNHRGASYDLYRLVIRNRDGGKLNDFRPCLTADGQVGLWDFVNRAFIPGSGEGRLLVPGDSAEPLFVDYIESTGSQYINTGCTVNPSVVMDMHFGSWKSVSDGAVFGLDRYNTDAFLLLQQGANFCFYGKGGSLCAATADTDYALHIEGGAVSLECATASRKQTDVTAVADAAASNPLYLFAYSRSKGFSKYRFYDLTLWASSADCSKGSPKLDLLPCCENGVPGLYNRVDGRFFANAKDDGAAFGFGGFPHRVDGTKLVVGDGTLAPSIVFDGCTEVEKVGCVTLDAAEVSSYPALTLRGGEFSLADGQAAVCRVEGCLKLSGGVLLSVDVAGATADCISAGSVDLTGASRGNPVEVLLPDPASFAGRVKLISGAGLAAADAEKFHAPGVDGRFKVLKGDLYLVSKTGFQIIVR